MDLERLKIDRSKVSRRPRRRRRAGWLVLLLLLAGAGWVFRRPLSLAVDRVRLPVVEVMRVSRASGLAASAVSGTAANGYVVARHRAALSADTPGRIVELNVEEGSVVRAGDVVARLYSEEYEAALRRAEADLGAAHVARERAAAEAASARARLDELRSQAEAARAQVEEAVATHALAEKILARSEELQADRVVSQDAVDRAQAALEEARARLVAARADVGRADAAVLTGQSEVAVAEAGIREAEARIQVLVAERDQAAATLEKTIVRAPFDGVIVLKDAEVGEVVSPNSLGSQSRGSVATIVDFGSLEVQVEVPETSIATVELGSPVAIYLDAYPDHRYDGRVVRIWPTANRQKATVEVRVAFDDPDERLRPEMGARAVFSPGEGAAAADEAPPAGSVLIPSEALVTIEGRSGVFIVERDVARFRPVRTGPRQGGRTLVEEGLDEGETIVSSPPHSLADGDRVRVL